MDDNLLNEGSTLLKLLQELLSIKLVWVKGHHKGQKSIEHHLKDTIHDLANAFLHSDQGYYSPNMTVIDPSSTKVSILFDGLTLKSHVPGYISFNSGLNPYKRLSAKPKVGQKKLQPPTIPMPRIPL
jgi:hypothetical protein